MHRLIKNILINVKYKTFPTSYIEMTHSFILGMLNFDT